MADCEKKFEIPVSGNLGLLALGYRGLEAWRKVRDESERISPESLADKKK